MGALTTAIQTYSQPGAMDFLSPGYQPPTNTPADPTPAEEASDMRRRNLLSRDRGRFGTVQTGFRGLLNITSSFGQRKTLLGE